METTHRPSKGQSGSNFDFRISYKVLPKENAIVRFGGTVTTTNINSNHQKSISGNSNNSNNNDDNEPNEGKY